MNWLALGYPIIKRGEICDPINQATFLCLSQAIGYPIIKRGRFVIPLTINPVLFLCLSQARTFKYHLSCHHLYCAI